MSLKTLLGFISTRVLRGGPRLIIQLSLAAFALLLLGKFFTSPTSTDTLFNSGSRWSWSPFGKSEEQQSVGTGGPGGVRVVSFGSPDIATPSTGKGAKGKGWTEMLCEEVPSTQDLPRETVWVFTFGTWDVWTLASLPRELGQGIVDAAVAALFAQVERVYQASLDAESVAFSDFWAYQDASIIEKLNNVDKGEGGVDPREIENFRIVVPELFDISLTPGWHAQRPGPPSPHTKAEQMTNAAHLTTRWNSEVKGRMDEWMRTADPQPEDDEERGKFGYVPSSQGTAARLRRARAESLGAPAEGEALRVPFPRRVGAQIDVVSFVREAIVENQMRAHGLTDMTGRGNRTDGEQGNVFFAETWVPCIWAKTSETPEAAGGYAACDAPGDYLFHSPFTLSERAIRETARIAAAETRSKLAFVDLEEESEGTGQEQEKPAVVQMKRHERRREIRGFQRALRPDRAMRLVDAACPTLDVC
ncbi:hypothetical protein Ct61P_12259 [Colletotrichum tofieldiae]|nr:hypothetical protein Ct61P_12259 [Colletotrichum tofieldiae]